MSDSTWLALLDAIEAHIADETGGAILGAWVLSAETLSPEWSDGFMFTGEGSHFAKIGLLTSHLKAITEERTVGDGD